MKLSKVNGQYAKSVGFYRKHPGGPRLQKRWYLGHKEAEAIVLAAKLVKAWREEVRSFKRSEELKLAAGIVMTKDQAAPVWAADFKIEHADETSEETLARLRREGKYIILPDSSDDIVLTEAVTWYMREKERRLILRNRSKIRQSSVTQIRTNLRACLAPFPQFLHLADFALLLVFIQAAGNNLQLLCCGSSVKRHSRVGYSTEIFVLVALYFRRSANSLRVIEVRSPGVGAVGGSSTDLSRRSSSHCSVRLASVLLDLLVRPVIADFQCRGGCHHSCL